MRINRREEEAGEHLFKLDGAYLEALKELTYGELVAWHASKLSSHAKYMIRDERHPKHDAPGGLTCDKRGCPSNDSDQP